MDRNQYQRLLELDDMEFVSNTDNIRKIISDNIYQSWAQLRRRGRLGAAWLAWPHILEFII